MEPVRRTDVDRAATAADAIALAEAHGATIFRPLPVVLTRGQGVWVEDVAGRRYLDCFAGPAVASHGHAHPRIVAALTEQAGRLAHASRGVYSDTIGPFLRDLAAATGYPRAIVMNSGAEAVETAVKVARKWAYTIKRVAPDRAEVIVASGNFHGRTIALVGCSSESRYREGFGPFPAGFRTVPYGDADAVAAACGPYTAAVLVEPIQGEGGVVVPPAGYLAALRRLCTAQRVLLVADEVQTGLGRTGRWFAWQHEEARPDLLVLGKALGGGVLPVSAVCGDDAVLGVLAPGDHGSTFGGNPLAAAVAGAALRVLRDERLVENAATQGAHFLARLRAVAGPAVREVRGRGLLLGAEVRPEAGTGRAFSERLLAEGLLVRETHGQVLRFTPPITITRDEVEYAVERLARVIGRTA